MSETIRYPLTEVKAGTNFSTEWLVTNGLGGYSFGTVAGFLTRAYHGYLIAAHPAPLGRMMMLNDLIEHVRFSDDTVAQLDGEQHEGLSFDIHGLDRLTDFYLDMGLPVWQYTIQDAVIERRLLMPHRQNTVLISYRLIKGPDGIRLSLRPSLQFRPHHAAVNHPLEDGYVLTVADDRYEVSHKAEIPALRFRFAAPGGTLVVDRLRIHEVTYRLEELLGYPAKGELWSPGYFSAEFKVGTELVLTASTESWEILEALTANEAIVAEKERRERLLRDASRYYRRASGHARASMDKTARELVLAADQFLVSPAGRLHHAARARAAGDELCSVIAGYPWFTDWGRDTMISLEGLTLTTGRITEAGWILRTFAHSIRNGLIPNLFPEHKREGLYYTADATLWFFHAIARYLEYSDDRSLLRTLLPKLEQIIQFHIKGTQFGIGIDPADGLLTQGDPTLPLTWMDAKKDDWVVTPRRGKAVEINALWYNALQYFSSWLHEFGKKDSAEDISRRAEQVHESFQKRFWYGDGEYLYDVVDGPEGDDPSCRPNQLLAISLPHPVLDSSRWRQVIETVKKNLLTPYGLRSLSPRDPEFKKTYEGDLQSRDAAYHQGTVWAWLIGPYIDAWMKIYPNRKQEARTLLDHFPKHFAEAGLGSISEIFDAGEPFTPRGCIAQAWSVAEVLRCWALTAGRAGKRRPSEKHQFSHSETTIAPE